jgi:hypothetical protein
MRLKEDVIDWVTRWNANIWTKTVLVINKNLSWYSNFLNAHLKRCVIAVYHAGMVKHTGRNYIKEFAVNFLGGS